MRILQIIIILISTSFFSQKKLSVTKTDSIPLNATTFLGINMYNSMYYTKGNVFYKKTEDQLYSYKNFTLGKISNIDFLNPLEITLFYKNFNTVVQLDRRLGQLKKKNFNFSRGFLEFSFVGTASNHRLWMFNVTNQQLEIYNLITGKTEAKTRPITSKIIKIVNTYNFCWILTPTAILQYNNYGSLIKHYKLSGFDNLVNSTRYFLLRKNNELFLFHKKNETLKKLNFNKIVIKDFYLLNETVYIYSGKKLYSYKINL